MNDINLTSEETALLREILTKFEWSGNAATHERVLPIMQSVHAKLEASMPVVDEKDVEIED